VIGCTPPTPAHPLRAVVELNHETSTKGSVKEGEHAFYTYSSPSGAAVEFSLVTKRGNAHIHVSDNMRQRPLRGAWSDWGICHVGAAPSPARPGVAPYSSETSPQPDDRRSVVFHLPPLDGEARHSFHVGARVA